jgi:hypothetical protein
MNMKNKCDLCDVKFWGTSIPYVGKPGWIYAIRKDEKLNWFSLIVNHNGDQDEFPIAFCPECGRELE